MIPESCGVSALIIGCFDRWYLFPKNGQHESGADGYVYRPDRIQLLTILTINGSMVCVIIKAEGQENNEKERKPQYEKSKNV